MRIIRILASVKITVVCLFLLFVLTFWGTVAQVEHGLYAAQERYFYSFFFNIFGLVPFPGAQLVLWVLFVNLIAAAITHFGKLRGVQYIGLKISHLGIFIYFIAAFVTFHVMTESNVHVQEGEGTNVSASYSQWELAFWKETGNEHRVTAIDVNKISGSIVALAPYAPIFTDGQMRIFLTQFYPNCAAFTKSRPQKPPLVNGSGITLLEPRAMLKEREKNVAGAIFDIFSPNGKQQYLLLLYGGESKPTALNINGQAIFFQLRHKRYVLPFTVRLKQFKVEFHPGTEVAKSYESTVEIIKPDARRDVRIYMNNPLRDKEYTFYQASYDIDAMGRKYSTLAVVKNAGQVLPYIACFTVFFGLALHFIMAAFRRKTTR